MQLRDSATMLVVILCWLRVTLRGICPFESFTLSERVFFVVVVVFNTIGLFKEMITCYLCVQPTALYMEMGELLRPLAAEPQLNRCQGLQGTWAAQWPAHWPGSPSLSPCLSCPLGEGLLTVSCQCRL